MDSGHWSIENPLHWVLDVIFKEDEARAKIGFIDENMALDLLHNLNFKAPNYRFLLQD